MVASFASFASHQSTPSPLCLPPHAQLEFMVVSFASLPRACAPTSYIYKPGGRPILVGDELSGHDTIGRDTICKLGRANQHGPTTIRL